MAHSRRHWLPAGILALAAAGLTQPAPAQAPAITIEREAPGLWRATYRLDAPARELRFTRAAAFHRERIWKVVTPGYAWARDTVGGDVVQVLRATGTPQRAISFEFGEYADALPKEYELFLAFTDGSVAIYTGHFYAQAGIAGRQLRRVRIVAPAGANVIVGGKVTRGPATYADSTGEGTYAYVGTIAPRTTTDVVAIIDPGMPRWLGALFDEYIPRLFAMYRRELGASLPWKPVVLYGFREGAHSGLSSGGGTLTGQVTLALEGADWRNETEDARRQAFHLLAHESAHLWNGQLVSSPGGEASWIHEGGADVMAEEALRTFGIVDTARYRIDRDVALNACASAVAAGGVHTAQQRGAFSEFYDCGAVLADWTVAALRASGTPATVFTFWRDLIVAHRQTGQYTEDDYFDVAQRAGASPAAIAAMRAFLDTRDFGVAVRGLAASNVALREGTAPPVAQQSYVRTAFAHLMGAACGGRLNFTWGRVVVAGPVRGCAQFATEVRVAAAGGFSFADQGAAVYDAVRSACAVGGTVPLQGEDGATVATVPCDKPLAARSPWFAWP